MLSTTQHLNAREVKQEASILRSESDIGTDKDSARVTHHSVHRIKQEAQEQMKEVHEKHTPRSQTHGQRHLTQLVAQLNHEHRTHNDTLR